VPSQGVIISEVANLFMVDAAEAIGDTLVVLVHWDKLGGILELN